MILPREIIPKVEAFLKRATLSGDRVYTDTQLQERATSRFSIQSILDYLDIGAVQASMYVKAAHLRDLQETKQPSSGAWDIGGTLRLMGNRAWLQDGVTNPRAARRTMNDHLDKESRGANASDQFPAYVYEKGELLFAADEENPDEARITFVNCPARTYALTTGYVNSTGDLTIDGAILDDVHEMTIVEMRDSNNVWHYVPIIEVVSATSAKVDYGSAIGSVGAKVTTLAITHAFTDLSPKLETALAQFAVAMCKAVYGSGDAQGIEVDDALKFFYSEIAQYRFQQFDLGEVRQ